jgi:hypothetical protein
MPIFTACEGAVLIFALMLVIKDDRASRNLGLTGSCHAVTAPKGQDGAWFGCVAGRLEGAPDLSRQGCKSVKFLGKRASAALPESRPATTLSALH